MTEWNRGNPDRYYFDHTLSDWIRLNVPSPFHFHTDSGDLIEFCNACWEPLYIVEEARKPNHSAWLVRELASRIGVPGLLVVLDGAFPKLAEVVHIGRGPGVLELGRTYQGQTQIELMLLLMRLYHAQHSHPQAPEYATLVQGWIDDLGRRSRNSPDGGQ